MKTWITISVQNDAGAILQLTKGYEHAPDYNGSERAIAVGVNEVEQMILNAHRANKPPVTHEEVSQL
jgi:hypothetical protein